MVYTAKNEPIVSLGKRFASPVKSKNPRGKRAKIRENTKEYSDLEKNLFEQIYNSQYNSSSLD